MNEIKMDDITVSNKKTNKDFENDEYFNLIFENNAAGILIIDADSKIILANNEFTNISGYSNDEIIGTYWYHYLNSEDVDGLKQYNLLQTPSGQNKSIKYELSFIKKDGQKRYALVSIGLMGNNKIVASLVDITERKQMEDKLKESENFLSNIIENNGALIYVKDAEGRYIRINKKWEEVTGIKRESVIGLSDSEIFPGEDGEKFKEMDLAVMNNRKVLEMEERLTKESGILHFLSIKFPIFDNNGEIKGLCGLSTEITSRKKIENDLKENEFKYKLLANNMNDVLWVVDPIDLKFLYLSPSIEHLLGYKAEELIGASFLEILPHEARNDFFSVNKQRFEEYKPELNSTTGYRNEFKYLCKDGSTVWVDSIVKYYYNSFSKKIEIQGVSRDVSHKKYMENALLKSEDKFKAIATHSASWEAWFSPAGKLLWMNDYATELTGYSADDNMINNDFLGTIVCEEDLNKANLYFQKALAGEKGNNLELLCKKKDGSKFWISTSWRPIYDSKGNSLGFRTSSRDITKNKIAEDEISKLTFAVDHSSASIIITNKNSVIEYVNQKFCDITYYTKEEALGRTPAILKSDMNPKSLIQELWDTILSGKEWRGVLRNRKKNGELYWESASISPIFNERKEITNFIAIKDDITEKKEAEEHQNLLLEQLKESKEIIELNLYQKNSLIEELSEAKEKLEKLNSEKDKFFSIIAHDLKNPLGNFKEMSKMIHDNYSDLLEDERKDILEMMKDSADNIYELLDNLLEWSRTQRGKIDFNPVDVDLFKIAENAVLISKFNAESKGVALNNNIKPETNIKADPNLINTIIRNLVMNSIKFTKSAGKINIGAEIKENEIEVSISDTGVGMKPEIFSNLFRIDVNITTPGTNNEKGTGLGLIICKEFIEKHAGRIWAESELGKGTTFYFTIPLHLKTS